MRVSHPFRAPEALPPGVPLLELRDVRVSYGGIKALRGISMTVAKGEVVALIGANGAGKTTTLKTIMGVLPLAGGSVHFAGMDLGGASIEERVGRGISLVP